MKQIEQIKPHPCAKDYRFYYTTEYQEPLLDYVALLAHDITNEVPKIEDMDAKLPFIGKFAERYFEKKIVSEIDEKKELFHDTNNVKAIDTIKAMGYDVDKFWYLTLFIYDYSYGFCDEAYEFSKTPRKEMLNLFENINQNVETYNDRYEPPTYKNKMKFTLSIEGQDDVTITSHETIYYLTKICTEEIEKIPKFSDIDNLSKYRKAQAFENRPDNLPVSFHTYYFTRTFRRFFELKPHKGNRAATDKKTSLNVMLLISKLAYIMGLSDSEGYLISTDTVKGYVYNYRDKNKRRGNGIYISEYDIHRFHKLG